MASAGWNNEAILKHEVLLQSLQLNHSDAETVVQHAASIALQYCTTTEQLEVFIKLATTNAAIPDWIRSSLLHCAIQRAHVAPTEHKTTDDMLQRSLTGASVLEHTIQPRVALQLRLCFVQPCLRTNDDHEQRHTRECLQGTVAQVALLQCARSAHELDQASLRDACITAASPLQIQADEASASSVSYTHAMALLLRAEWLLFPVHHQCVDRVHAHMLTSVAYKNKHARSEAAALLAACKIDGHDALQYLHDVHVPSLSTRRASILAQALAPCFIVGGEPYAVGTARAITELCKRMTTDRNKQVHTHASCASLLAERAELLQSAGSEQAEAAAIEAIKTCGTKNCMVSVRAHVAHARCAHDHRNSARAARYAAELVEHAAQRETDVLGPVEASRGVSVADRLAQDALAVYAQTLMQERSKVALMRASECSGTSPAGDAARGHALLRAGKPEGTRVIERIASNTHTQPHHARDALLVLLSCAIDGNNRSTSKSSSAIERSSSSGSAYLWRLMDLEAQLLLQSDEVSNTTAAGNSLPNDMLVVALRLEQSQLSGCSGKSSKIMALFASSEATSPAMKFTVDTTKLNSIHERMKHAAEREDAADSDEKQQNDQKLAIQHAAADADIVLSPIVQALVRWLRSEGLLEHDDGSDGTTQRQDGKHDEGIEEHEDGPLHHRMLVIASPSTALHELPFEHCSTLAGAKTLSRDFSPGLIQKRCEQRHGASSIAVLSDPLADGSAWDRSSLRTSLEQSLPTVSKSFTHIEAGAEESRSRRDVLNTCRYSLHGNAGIVSVFSSAAASIALQDLVPNCVHLRWAALADCYASCSGNISRAVQALSFGSCVEACMVPLVPLEAAHASKEAAVLLAQSGNGVALATKTSHSFFITFGNPMHAMCNEHDEVMHKQHTQRSKVAKK